MSATDDIRHVKVPGNTPAAAVRKPNGAHVLACIGIGATVVTFDVVVGRVRIPLWLVWGSGIAGVLMILLPAVLWLVAPRHRVFSGRDGPSPQLRARECRRAQRQLQRFLAEESLPWSNDSSTAPGWRRRREQRARAILIRYHSKLHPWLVQVLDDAIELGAAAPSARHLLDARDVEQLTALPELFREAAEELSRRRA